MGRPEKLKIAAQPHNICQRQIYHFVEDEISLAVRRISPDRRSDITAMSVGHCLCYGEIEAVHLKCGKHTKRLGCLEFGAFCKELLLKHNCGKKSGLCL